MDGKDQIEGSEKMLNKECAKRTALLVPIPSLLIDTDSKVVMINAAASELLGISASDAKGMRLKDICGGALGKPGDPVIEAIRSGRAPGSETINFTNDNGVNVISTITAEPVCGDDEEPSGGLLFLMPSSSDRALEDKVQLYEQILDTLPWPLSVTDMNMNWTFINKPVEDMLKIKRKDMLGKHCSNWGANICKTKNCGVECLRADKPRTFFEQQNMNFQVDVAYIKGPKGDKIGHIEIVQDVTANSKMDAYRAEFTSDLSQNLKRLAKGDMDITPKLPADNQYIADKVRSSYIEINTDFCEARDAVNALVADANMLSKAAVEGKLSTRADASKHQGDYRKVVQGVNDTLDAVIGPLNCICRLCG